MNDARLKHLEFIQTTINRMAGNSFLLKGWAITLIGGALALTFKELDRRYLLISLAVLILFWFLDGYYLSRERNYIKLYENVRTANEVDFSMNAHGLCGKWVWPRCTFSKTLVIFYGGLLMVIILINHFL